MQKSLRTCFLIDRRAFKLIDRFQNQLSLSSFITSHHFFFFFSLFLLIPFIAFSPFPKKVIWPGWRTAGGTDEVSANTRPLWIKSKRWKRRSRSTMSPDVFTFWSVDWSSRWLWPASTWSFVAWRRRIEKRYRLQRIFVSPISCNQLRLNENKLQRDKSSNAHASFFDFLTSQHLFFFLLFCFQLIFAGHILECFMAKHLHCFGRPTNHHSPGERLVAQCLLVNLLNGRKPEIRYCSNSFVSLGIN